MRAACCLMRSERLLCPEKEESSPRFLKYNKKSSCPDWFGTKFRRNCFSLHSKQSNHFQHMEFLQLIIDFILHIDQHMIQLVQDYHLWTYAILFVIIFCETGLVVTPFLPGDSLLFVAGAITALPEMPLEIGYLVVIVFVAAVLGDSCNYMIGHFFGKKLFSNPDSRIFKQSYLEKTHDFFRKYGGKTIILARFIPIVRTFAPFVAGMGKMNYYYFMVYNLVGAALWVGIFCFAGYFFGDLPFVQRNLKLLLLAIIVISVLPAVVEVLRAKLKRNAG